MKANKYPRATTLAASILTISLATTAFAAKGGKGKPGGGDGGSDGSAEKSVPPLVTAPITYEEIELLWENAADEADPGFLGTWVAGVNRAGIVAGNVKRPPLNDNILGDDEHGERLATSNIQIDSNDQPVKNASGELIPTGVLVDLNRVFGAALATLNGSRKVENPTETDWRIAYGRRINDAGLIACQLIPTDEARSWGTGDSLPPVSSLLVVGDLHDTSALLEVNPDNVSPDQDFVAMNQHGDVLVRDLESAGWTTRCFVWVPPAGGNGTPAYVENLLPDSVTPPSFNSNLEVSYSTETSENGRFVVDRLYRTGLQDPLWERRGKDYDHFDFQHIGVADSGAVYVSVDFFEGGQVSFPEIPYHVTSSSERVPLVDVELEGNADGTPTWDNAPVLSQTPTAGEEEIILRRYVDAPGRATIDYVIYKPRFEARFRIFPSEDYPLGGDIQNVAISAPVVDGTTTPHDPDPETGENLGNYFGGIVAYSSWFVDEGHTKSYTLTPSQTQP